MPAPRQKPTSNKASASSSPPQVSGRWLLKAIGGVIVAALICSYLSLCLLYRIGQWQIVLHPDPTAKTKPAPAGMIRFGPDESGRPQLTGEMLSGDAGARYSTITVLFLAGGDGSRLNAAATVNELRELGLNVLWFDYRGYGLSGNIHPNQQRMSEDAESAWRYLIGTREIAPRQIVVYGTGVGASLAAKLASEHSEIPAIILDAPYTDLLKVAQQDSRSSVLPTELLFHERFPLVEQLSTLSTPKLLIYSDKAAEPSAFATAATPKQTVSLPSATSPLFKETLTRFLDQYMGGSVPQIVPSVAPAGTKQH
jgi:pimeloyl-ACP methyl ester carboxylesterase